MKRSWHRTRMVIPVTDTKNIYVKEELKAMNQVAGPSSLTS